MAQVFEFFDKRHTLGGTFARQSNIAPVDSTPSQFRADFEAIFVALPLPHQTCAVF